MRAIEGPSSWNLFEHIHHKNESFFLKTLPSRKRPSMANDAEADFHCVIVIAVNSKHSSYHKYSFIFLYLCFSFSFFSFFIYLKIYCSSAIDFSMCDYDNILFLLFNIREPIPYKPGGFSWAS